MSDKNTSKVIRFYDTTLRDGEQTPGVAFTREHRVRIARALDAMGMDEIEVGFAASGKEQRDDMREVICQNLKARTLSLSRPIKSDIDAALQVGVDGVIIFIGVSDMHLNYKFNKTYKEAVLMACEAISYARSKGLFVQSSLEDATRTDTERLQDFVKKAVKAGANRISLADTVGVGVQVLVTDKVTAVKDVTDLPVAVHNHDDFGLAVSNSLAAVQAGASVISSTMNGIGERAGNTSTEQCALALELLMGYKTNIDLTKLVNVSNLVAECSGLPVPPNRPVIGKNCFRHESGIHVAAILKNPLCYEPYDPSLIGAKREITLGKTSGRAAIRHIAGEIGEKLTDNECELILKEIKYISENGLCGDKTVIMELINKCRSMAL